MPNVLETTDAAASTATTYNLGIGQTAQGVLGAASDHDFYRVNLVAGQQYTFAMIGTGVTNDVDDTFLRLRDSSGTEIANNDDVAPQEMFSSSLTFTATTTGVYYLDAGAFGNETGQYGISAALGPRAVFDEMMGAGALVRPNASWSTPGTAATVTWAVRATFANSTDASDQAAPFSQLTASEIATVRASMGFFSDAARVSFTQVNPGGVSNNATMLISNYTSTTDGAGAYALYPGDANVTAPHGDIRINTDSVDTASQPRGSYSFFAIMHEMGHALGLAHPGAYNAAPGVDITYANAAQFQQDSHQYTVMSYFDEESTTTSYNSYPDTLMLYDILAMQQLYGANMTTRTGNTVYGFGSNAGAAYDFAINTDPVMSIWDAGGTDTINAAGFAQAQRIDLVAGHFSNIGGYVGNVSIAFGATIENATGGSGADTLIGNTVANVLNGGGGADTMQGNGGGDTYVVDNALDKIFDAAGGGGVDRVLVLNTSYALTAGAEVEVLQFNNIALTTALNLSGNEFAQTLIGNAGINVLNGGGGADIMQGLGGGDTYVVDNALDRIVDAAGGGGVDRVLVLNTSYALNAGAEVELIQFNNIALTTALNLSGNEFAQTLIGNAGINILNGGGGADIMQGLGGGDTYVVDNALDRIVDAAGGGGVDRVLVLNTSYALNTGAEVELLQFNNIALTTPLNLSGNEFAQTLIGNAGINILNGGGGADIMQGNGGGDTYVVDNALDRIIDAAGGGGADRVLVLNTSYTLTAGAEVELLQFNYVALTTALNLSGNEFAQTLIGNAGINVINGGGGADIMQGNGGGDTYVVDNALDRIVDAAGGGGTDRVLVLNTSYALTAGAEVELLQFNYVALTTALNLSGNEFAQTLIGNAGINVLNGGGGADTITGGSGADFFDFTTALGGSNVDRLTDFTSADTIRLENAIFTGLVGTGVLSAAQFVANTTGVAANANQHIIYETDTGNLYYDSNGNGAGGSVLFAQLNPGLSLTSADFVII